MVMATVAAHLLFLAPLLRLPLSSRLCLQERCLPAIGSVLTHSGALGASRIGAGVDPGYFFAQAALLFASLLSRCSWVTTA